jgi:hypothetical protein
MAAGAEPESAAPRVASTRPDILTAVAAGMDEDAEVSGPARLATTARLTPVPAARAEVSDVSGLDATVS